MTKIKITTKTTQMLQILNKAKISKAGHCTWTKTKRSLVELVIQTKTEILY